MFITKDWAIAHTPKCGGHALAVMMTTAGVKFKQPFPFKIVNGKIIESNATKHSGWKGINPKLKKYMLFRRLPQWYLSIYIHQSKHTATNIDNVRKVGMLRTYKLKYKKRPYQLLLPKFIAHTVYPDTVLKKYYCKELDGIIRMESLVADVNEHLNIQLTDIPKTYSYRPPERYWNNEALAILYSNNPCWAELEEKVYGSLLQMKS